MIFNDQPGRFLVVTVIGPLMFWAGHELKKSACEKDSDRALYLASIVGPPLNAFAMFFIVYEIFWILCAAPRTA